MKKFLLLLLSLSTFMLLITGCAQQTEVNRVEKYLREIEPIMIDFNDVTNEVFSLYENLDKYPSSQIIHECATLMREFNDVHERFSALETPPECSKLSIYIGDAIRYSFLQLFHLAALYETGDTEYIDSWGSYVSKTKEALALLADEWERLLEPTRKTEDSQNLIGLIWIGILAIGILVAAAKAIKNAVTKSTDT